VTSTTPRIALVGDRSDHRSHLELNALRDQLEADIAWVPTDAGDLGLGAFDGVWLVPGSPYADEAAALDAITFARSKQVPFLGTCGGMQYAVIEALRHLGHQATHAETQDPTADASTIAVAALPCSLQGQERVVTPVPGSRFAGLVEAPFRGMHFCGYAPTASAIFRLIESGVVVGATAPDAGAEVLEFPDHPFFFTSMFQPHVGALAGAPVHPLVAAFVSAARTYSSARIHPLRSHP
jgi:CTP synthase (UTP-ammonia lyase)